MTKNSSNRDLLNNIVFYTVLVGLVGTGTAIIAHHIGRKNARREIIKLSNEIKQVKDDKFTYMTSAPEFAQNRKMKKTIDSLKTRNSKIVQNTTNEYFANVNKTYTLGRFFTDAQIKKMNRIANFVGPLLNSKTSIAEFEETLTIMDIPADKFMQFGVIIDGGYIHMFRDEKRQRLFEEYLDAVEMAFSHDGTDAPNPNLVRGNAEYIKNQHKIDSLQRRISGNSFIIGNTIMALERRQDSLRAELAKNREKLR